MYQLSAVCSIWRKVQEMGLQAAYVNDHQLRQNVHELLACAFVPTAEIEATFTHWWTNLVAELEQLADYFSETYVSGWIVRGRRL